MQMDSLRGCALTWTSIISALRNWIVLMSDLELINVLEGAVFGLALAQILTIILPSRRERDVEDLRELVEEQRLRHAELRAWLAGRSASQSSRIASDGKPVPDWTANLKVSESGMPMLEPKPCPRENDPASEARALE